MRSLGLVLVAALALAGCNSSEVEALKKENGALKAEVETLKATVAEFKKTADFYFKSGQDSVAAKNWDAAIYSFDTVIKKYPNDPLVGPAKKALEAAEKARQEYRLVAAQQEEQRKAAVEKENAAVGEEIDYETFYAKSKTGLPLGKRYRFEACLSSSVSCLDNTSEFVNQTICGLEPEFDDEAEYEAVLREGRRQCGTVVASMRYGGTIGIHRLH